MRQTATREYIPTVIVGGSQAGLTMGYHLQRAGERFVVLDAKRRVGDSWRASVGFTAAVLVPKYASLPGWPMPLRSFPSHDEMADYLEAYARHFELPVRTGTRVSNCPQHRDRFVCSTPTGDLLGRSGR